MIIFPPRFSLFIRTGLTNLSLANRQKSYGWTTKKIKEPLSFRPNVYLVSLNQPPTSVTKLSAKNRVMLPNLYVWARTSIAGSLVFLKLVPLSC
jgi:hypothetical protein